jgi:hypothetical protein
MIQMRHDREIMGQISETLPHAALPPERRQTAYLRFCVCYIPMLAIEARVEGWFMGSLDNLILPVERIRTACRISHRGVASV